MNIVTDSGCDLNLTPNEVKSFGIHVVPLMVTLSGQTYQEGPQLDAPSFYQRLETGSELPVTSQPSAGVFADLYRKLARTAPEIFSIHISSGLSGTLNSARLGATEVPEAKVTFFDTKTLSVGAGWQVEAAARAFRSGWPMEKVLTFLERLRASTETMFTLRDLKYLIHGGRISHIKGLVASMLNIKPIIGVEKERGMYSQYGQARAFSGAVKTFADLVADKFSAFAPVRAQVVHALNPEGAAELQKAVGDRIACAWLPISRLSLVLGAHTGPTMVGAVITPSALYAEVP